MVIKHLKWPKYFFSLLIQKKISNCFHFEHKKQWLLLPGFMVNQIGESTIIPEDFWWNPKNL